MTDHKLCFSFVIVSLIICKVNAAEECLTPNSQDGDCKPLDQCDALYSLLKHRPLSANSANFLKKSQCGFAGTLPKVCCPLGSFIPPTQKPPVVDGGSTESTVEIPVSSTLLPDVNTCGIVTSDRIYGGTATDLDEFPWMALVEYEKPNRQKGFYCGGVLINNRYVLTAAHCVKGKDLPPTWRLVSVRLGEYNTDTDTDCVNHGYGEDCAPPPLDIAVEERIAHEDYDPNDVNQYHDIALLRLRKKVSYSDYVKPICLPTSQELVNRNFVNTEVFVAGWGKTENRSESNVKLKVQVPVRTGTDCSSVYSAARVKLGAGQLCAGGVKGRDSCRGDSGGPLMTITTDNNRETNWYAIGVVSFGPSPCGMENWPGVYTKVARYVNWIVGKLRD